METTDYRSNPTQPNIGVGAAVIKNDKILLIKRGKPPKQGQWSLPGGGIQVGETIKDAIVREVTEETGLTVTPVKLLDIVEYIENKDGKIIYHYVLVDWLAEIKSDQDPVASSDAADARFFTFEETLSLPIWNETRRIIQLARAETNAQLARAETNAGTIKTQPAQK